MAAKPKPQACILDACLFIDLLHRNDPGAARVLANASTGKIRAALSSITVAELWVGVGGAAQDRERSLAIAPCQIYDLTASIAIRAGQMQRHSSNPPTLVIPLPDAIIAATAEAYKLTIISRDRHLKLLATRYRLKYKPY